MSGRRGRHYLSEMRNGSQRKPTPLLETPSHASVHHLLKNLRHDFDRTFSSQKFHPSPPRSKRQFSSKQSATRHTSTRQFLPDVFNQADTLPRKQLSSEDLNMHHARQEIERQFLNEDLNMPRRRQESESRLSSEEFDMPHSSLRSQNQFLTEEFDMPRRRRESDRFTLSHTELESRFDLSRSMSTYRDSREYEDTNGADTASEDLNIFPRGRETERHLSPQDFNPPRTRPKRQLLPDDVDLRKIIDYKRQLATEDLNLPITKIKFSPEEFVLSPVVHKFRRQFLSEDINLPPTRSTSERQFLSEEFDLPPTRPKHEKQFRSEEFDLPPTRPKSKRQFWPEEFDVPPTRPKFERQLPPNDLNQSHIRFHSERKFPPEDMNTTHAGLPKNMKRALLPTPGEEPYQNKKRTIETSSSKGLLPLPDHTFPKSGLLPIPTRAGLPPRPFHSSRAPECRATREAIKTAPPLREPGIQHVHSRPLPPLMPPECKKQAYPVTLKNQPALSSLLPEPRMQKYVLSAPSRVPLPVSVPPELKKQAYSVKVEKLSSLLPGPRMQPLVRDVGSPTNFKKRPLLPTPSKPAGILSKIKPLLQISPEIVDQSIIPPLLQAPWSPINKRANNKNSRIDDGSRRPIFKEPMMTPPMLPTRISKFPTYHHKKNLVSPDCYPLDSNESGRKRPLLPIPDLF